MPRSLRPTPMPIGTLSLTHAVSRRLLVAPRPPSPSRLSPLELVGRARDKRRRRQRKAAKRSMWRDI